MVIKRRIVAAITGGLVTAWLVAACVAIPVAPANYPEEVGYLAQEALAEQLAITADRIEVTSAEQMTWSDASLGCPEQGIVYAQVIVSGYRVALKVDEQTFDVHTGNGNAVVCGPGGKPMMHEEGDTPSDNSGPEAEKAAAMAKQSLVEVIGVAADGIEVLSTEPVQWSDAGLGCREPDKVYAQVLVPGYTVILGVDEETYEVHTGGDNAVICGPEGRPLETRMGGVESTSSDAVSKAKDDLAARLTVDVTEIEVVKVESIEWRSSGLGCEQSGKNYLQVIVSGQLILLKTGEQVYEYHAGEGRVILCQESTK